MTVELVPSNLITWEEAYSIGNEKIDKEHKKLFEVASDLNNYTNSKEDVIKIIKELIKYTKLHFSNEENFMESVSYKNLDAHKKLHKKMVDKLNEIVKSFNDVPLKETIDNLVILVNKNILNHILIEDKKVHHLIRTREELKENFKWKMSYQLGETQLDEEHQKLFDIAIRALNNNNKDMKKSVKETIIELYDYMKTHFEHEQQYMKDIAYPNFEEHKEIHDNIIEEMNEFIKLLPKLKIVDFEKKLIEFMDIWLINHILYEDKKIINFTFDD